jgi:hypothetical protein
METRGRRDHAPEALDFRFVAGAAIIAAVVIALSLAVGVPIAPEAAMLVAP